MTVSPQGHKELRVIFFGDSICFGQGVSIHSGWVTRISAQLEQLGLRENREILVVNSSVNGNTTRQALERMPYDVQSHGVDLLLVQFGMNDCNHWQTDKGVPRVSRLAFEANLIEIVERGIVHGAKAIVLNTNHPTSRSVEYLTGIQRTYEDNNRLYNEVIRKIGTTFGPPVQLIDIEAAFEQRIRNENIPLSHLLLPDALHLSVKGHDIYFQEVWPVVAAETVKMLKEVSWRPDTDCSVS